MDLKELGSLLKEERERQGLSMEMIMELTKISRVNIVAIEEGNQKDFPHQVYAKGFIKNYAKNLGLDAEEIGEEFTRIISGTPAGDDPVVRAETSVPPVSSGANKSPLGSIIVIFLLIAVVGGLVYYLHDNSIISFGQQKQEQAISTEQVAPKQEEPVAKSVDESIQPEPKAKPAEVIPAATTAQAEELAPVEPVVQTAETEEVKVPAKVENVVVITAKPEQACWLEVDADGEVKEFVIQEGDSLAIPYKDSLKIKLGNGGGVDVASNGKPFAFKIPKSKVVHLEFPAAQ